MALLEPIVHRRTVNPHDQLGMFPPDVAGGPAPLRAAQREIRTAGSALGAAQRLLQNPRKAIDRQGFQSLTRGIQSLETALARLKHIHKNLSGNRNPSR